MKMKKAIYLIMGLFLLLAGCSNEEQLFESKANIYFKGDSTVFSWLRTTNTTDTVYLPCQIVGQAPAAGQTFSVEVMAGETNAQEGIHYGALPEFFTWPAGAFTYSIPIVIYYRDPLLVERFYKLRVRLKGGSELMVNYTGKLEYSLLMGAQVVKPIYWDTYTMSAFFGAYSRTKHSIVVLLAGKDFPESQKEYKREMVFWQNFGIGELNTYFKNNVVKDENGNVIEPWI